MDEDEFEPEYPAPPASETETQPEPPGPELPDTYQFEDWALI
ncbi:MAG: hypothetical protein AAGK37_02105 [Pseudomonadota bacterium]